MKDRIIFWINSRCNLKCPQCIYGIHQHVDYWNADWEYVNHAARFLHGITSIVISGGEPTIHPLFDEFAGAFRSLFGCKELRVETNAVTASKHGKAFQHFDYIQASRYDPKDNGEGIAWLERNFLEKLIVSPIPITHRDRSLRPGTKPCGRGTGGTGAYSQGKLYPCCVGMGIEGASGIPLTEDWKKQLSITPIPCHNCCFAEP